MSLIAKKGAMVLNSKRNTFKEVLSDEDCRNTPSLLSKNLIKRVEIGWNGLVLRNWLNEDVFYADADTGDLTLKGKIEATSGHIGTWSFNSHKLWADSDVSQEGIYTTFVALNAGSETQLQKSDGSYYQDTHGNILTVNTNPYAFWAGSANPAQAPFSIQKNGEIKAASGKIGGWKITSNFLYANNTIVLAPTGQQSNAAIRIPILDENGKPVLDEETNEALYTTFNLNGTVLWGPGPSGDTENLIASSLTNAKFTLNKDGDLTVASINGWQNQNFTTPKNTYIVTASSQDGIRLLNMRTGRSYFQNFNTLNNATASWRIEASPKVRSGGGQDKGYLSTTRELTISCIVTSGSHTKTFYFSKDLSVSVNASGSTGAYAHGSFSDIGISTGTLTIDG